MKNQLLKLSASILLLVSVTFILIAINAILTNLF